MADASSVVRTFTRATAIHARVTEAEHGDEDGDDGMI